MKEKLLALAEYMRENQEPFFLELVDVKSVAEAAKFAWDKWHERSGKKVKDAIDAMTGKELVDAKVNWVLKLSEEIK